MPQNATEAGPSGDGTPNYSAPETQSATTPMSRDAAIAHLTATDPRFAVEEATINGQRYRVFANAPNNLRELLKEAVEAYGDRDLLVYQDERWTYSEFASVVNRLAQGLRSELGIQPGDRVAIAMRNFPEMPMLLMAIVSIGAVVVPLNAWWSAEELAFALDDSQVSAVFADGPRYDAIKDKAKQLELPLIAVRDADGPLTFGQLMAGSHADSWPDVPVAPDDDFAVLYSSGSSGRPKGVILTHRGAISSVQSWKMGRVMLPLMDPAMAPDPAKAPSSLIVTPLFHVTALHSLFLQGVALGAKLILMYKWQPEQAARLIDQEQVTRFVGVPTQSAELVAAAKALDLSLDTLETIGSGGAKRPASQVAEIQGAFPGASVATGWGMTETNSLGILLSGPEYHDNPEAAGRLTPPLQEMRIVNDQGAEVAPGEVGELIVRSPANMRGYLNLPHETEATLRDGWLYTGDLARVDDNGLVYIVDRKKSIILRGGENIACLEVEGALHQHPEIVEACVFPVPDERLGEVVGAAIYLKEGSGLDQETLSAFLTDRLAAFKLPEKIWFWQAPLPRGGTDKLDRKTLQRLCLSRL